MEGDARGAAAAAEEQIALSRADCDRRSTAMAFSNLGDVAMRDGDLERARTFYSQSLLLQQELPDVVGSIETYERLGHLEECERDAAAAIRHFAQAQARRDHFGIPVAGTARETNEQCVSSLRERLGASFERMWAEAYSDARQDILA